MYRNNRPGCLGALLELFLLDRLFNWLQGVIGFRRGGLIGCGCGPILFILFVLIACGIICNTNWLHLFAPVP
ncbi:MAG TPA: hypothetical protein VFK30_04080 [Anaerolineae bacterium]|nr:hypothetical protein [Anaerolineae bacterium]